MSDGTTLPGTGDKIRDIDRGAAGKTQVVQLDHGGASAESLTSPTNPLPVVGIGGFDVQATVTRPANTTAYLVNQAIADSTSAPTAGGFTLTGVARASGGLVMLTDLFISSSKPSNLQGWLYLFNQAATANNDAATFAMSDADIVNLVAAFSFGLNAEPANSWAHLQGLSVVMACAGTADLRFLLKTAAGYSPDSAEIIKVRAKGLRLN